MPTLNNHVYFKRFEADVITERKLFIIRLLDYIGQHPILYKSQAFQEFFAKGQSMPAEERLQFDDALFDQTADSIDIASKNSESQDSAALSASSSMSESVYSQLTSSRSSLTDQSVDHVDTTNSVVELLMPHYEHHTIDYGQLIETPKMPNQRADLSQFRVLRAFGNVMQVQDTNTKHVYIMKSIYKSAVVDDDTYLPSNFPFMVSLVAYYLSDSNVYLLLEQARYDTITRRLIAAYCFLFYRALSHRHSLMQMLFHSSVSLQWRQTIRLHSLVWPQVGEKRSTNFVTFAACIECACIDASL